jgi:hypothetical protein
LSKVSKQVLHIKWPHMVWQGMHNSSLHKMQMNFASILWRSSSVILIPGMLDNLCQRTLFFLQNKNNNYISIFWRILIKGNSLSYSAPVEQFAVFVGVCAHRKENRYVSTTLRISDTDCALYKWTDTIKNVFEIVFVIYICKY